MQLTEHFCLTELTSSVTGTRLGIDNTPPVWAIENLRYLARVLETIRRHFGRPVRVSSGYRCPDLNLAVGGSPTSAHRYGLAADFRVDGVPVIEVCRWIETSLIGFDQVIYEFGESGWCHLGLCEEGALVRQESLTATKQGGNTVYKIGIISAT